MTSEYERLLKNNRKIICTSCGGPLKYQSSGIYVCDSCGAIECDDFGKIKMYLAEKGPASKEEIVSATGVSKESVNRYLKQQRLMVHEESKRITCRICGKGISSGSLCTDCATGNHSSSAPKNTGGRMRFNRKK